MRVKCKNCGKVFDPEKTSSMCPRCGTWYTNANHYDAGNSGQGTIYDCENCQDKKENKRVHSDARIVAIVTVVGLLIIILMRAISGACLSSRHSGDRDGGYYDGYDDDEDDTLYDETKEGDGNYYVDSVPVTGYAYGDKMVNENASRHGEWLIINSVSPVELEDADVPDGYVIYDMNYDMGSQGNSFAEFAIGESSYDVYLRSNSWRMLRPLSQEDIDDLVMEDGYAEAHGIADEIDPDYSHLYFMVRSGDLGYAVVYCQDSDSDGYEYKPVNGIYIVGEKADASVWYDVSTMDDVTEGTLYKLYKGDFGQKLEKDGKYTLPGGAVITTDEICDLSGADIDDDKYDYYLVSDILLNHGARKGTCELMSFDTGSDTDPIKYVVPYSEYAYNEYSGDGLLPMSVEYQYIVYGIRKGQPNTMAVAYSFGSSIDEIQYETAGIPIPEQ